MEKKKHTMSYHYSSLMCFCPSIQGCSIYNLEYSCKNWFYIRRGPPDPTLQGNGQEEVLWSKDQNTCSLSASTDAVRGVLYMMHVNLSRRGTVSEGSSHTLPSHLKALRYSQFVRQRLNPYSKCKRFYDPVKKSKLKNMGNEKNA